MPIPSYIICSRSVSTDKHTNFYSIFEVIDRIIIASREPADGERPILLEPSFHVTSSWLLDRSAGEKVEDEFILKLTATAGNKEVLSKEMPFKFTHERTPHRFSINLVGLMSSFAEVESDEAVIECSARKASSEESQSHRYTMQLIKAHVNSFDNLALDEIKKQAE